MKSRLFHRFFLSVSGILALAALPATRAQTGYQGLNPQYQVANMQEDIRVLDERTRSLTLQVEQLTRENQTLRDRIDRMGDLTSNVVTLAQLNQAVAEATRGYQAGDREMLLNVTKQIEQLAKQTQAAIDSLATGISQRPATVKPSINFTDDYPKTGVTYTVAPGDTISSIATRFNSSIRDIQNANKIADPKGLQVGQTLFIPQK
ncbi:MAG: LysM peptidoglycan-binding domain-containing protein [Opitutaceae bacterium]